MSLLDNLAGEGQAREQEDGALTAEKNLITKKRSINAVYEQMSKALLLYAKAVRSKSNFQSFRLITQAAQ